MKTYLTANQAAEYLQVHPQTLVNWRADGTGPPWHVLPKRRIRYSVDDLDLWISAYQRGEIPDPF